MVEGGGLLNRYRGLNPLSRVRIPPSPPTLFPVNLGLTIWLLRQATRATTGTTINENADPDIAADMLYALD